MPKTSKRKSHDGRKRSRSSSSGSRDKKRSVFDRLGTKALPLEPPLCRHDLQYGSCPNCSVNLSIPLLLNSFKRGSKEKESRKSEEEVDWSKWDSTELEGEDEKSLERRRQLLKQQLGLHMISDLARKKAKSTSSSSSSSSSDISSSSSSSDSSSPDIPSNQNASSRGVMDDSIGYKSGKYGSPSSKLYKKKSVSPVFLRNPSPPKESRKKNMGRSKGHDDEDDHGVSRERRREDRHRRERSSTSSSVNASVSHHQNPYASMSSRKKDDERSSRREESRRDRKSVSRSDSRSCQYEDMSRSSSRYSERGCRERGRDRDRHRDSSKTSSRSNDGSRRRSEKDHYSRSCHDSKHYQQLSPSSHHHYRSERSSRYGSNERERITVCKELSPRESDSRVRISSSSYSDSRSGRRRGWEGSRYDSPKSSRDWDQSTQSERGESRDWDRRSKPRDEKEFNTSDKEKDSDWKTREREEEAASPAKRPRIEEPPPISEQLSDISDDPDDILNQDDVDELIPEPVLEPIQKKEEAPVVSSNSEQSILDQKIRGEDSLSEISDEDLQLEEESKNKGDTLGVDWRSLVVECYHIRKSVREERSAAKHSWDADSIFRRTGVSRRFAGDVLFDEIDAALRKEGGDGLLTDIGGLQRSKMEAKKTGSDMFCQQTALSARMDLMLRRQLCGLPILGLETRTLYQFQAI